MMGPGFFGCCGWGGSFGSYSWIGMLAGLIINILVIVAIIWLVVWLVRRIAPSGGGIGTIAGRPSAREILQARYARGEITREQYLEMLSDLE